MIPTWAKWSSLGASIFIVLVITLWAVFVRTTVEAATVTGKTWQREIEVQKYQTLHETDWSYPNDARNIDTFRAIHHYDQVLVGYNTYTYECGTTRNPETCTSRTPIYVEIPVYRNKYHYDVDRWKRERWLTTTGTYDTPTWAEIPKTLVNINILGQEREGSQRHENYQVHVVCAHEDCNENVGVDLTKFGALVEGSKVHASVTATGHVRSINLN